MEPVDDAARTAMTDARRRGKFHGLPHRVGGGGDPIQRGPTKVASEAQPGGTP
jgi:hypothetical protein